MTAQLHPEDTATLDSVVVLSFANTGGRVSPSPIDFATVGTTPRKTVVALFSAIPGSRASPSPTGFATVVPMEAALYCTSSRGTFPICSSHFSRTCHELFVATRAFCSVAVLHNHLRFTFHHLIDCVCECDLGAHSCLCDERNSKIAPGFFFLRNARVTSNSQKKKREKETRSARIQGAQFTAGRTPGAHGPGSRRPAPERRAEDCRQKRPVAEEA